MVWREILEDTTWFQHCSVAIFNLHTQKLSGYNKGSSQAILEGALCSNILQMCSSDDGIFSK